MSILADDINWLTLLARLSVSHVMSLDMRQQIYEIIDNIKTPQMKDTAWDIINYNFNNAYAKRCIMWAINIRRGDKRRNWHLFSCSAPIRDLIGWSN